VIDNEKPKIVRSGVEADYYIIELNEGVINASVSSNNNPVFHQIEKNKFIQIYNTFNSADSILLQLEAQDSARNILMTSINIKFAGSTKIKSKPKVFTVDTSPKNSEKITSDLKYKIYFSKPIQKFDLSKIELLADTITPIPIDIKKDLSWNNSFTQLTLSKNIGNSRLTRLQIPEEVFFTIENDTNKRIVTNHELKNIEEYGTISGMITTNEKKFIIQLLNSNYAVVNEQYNTASYRFDYLEAGNYFVRVIIDSNGNGVWDQGNFKENTLPEKVIFLKNEIPLKQNWEINGQDISF
jgi:hypothetical protein